MGLMGRAGKALAGMFKPAEDPRQTFASPYMRQQQLLERVQQALHDLEAAKGRLTDQTAQVRDKLPQLHEQAKRALIADREDLARLALERRAIADSEVAELQQHLAAVETEEQRLALVEQRLSTEIEAFRARQEVIAARYSAAEAQVRINEALGGVSQEMADLTDALEKAEQTTEHMQARATAIDELVRAGILDTPNSDAIAAQFKALDVSKAVNGQLDALRAEISGSKGTAPTANDRKV
jgi:phage shock protein A